MQLSNELKEKLNDLELQGHKVFILGQHISFPIEALETLTSGELEELRNHFSTLTP